MTLKEQINLELDDVYLNRMEELVQKEYPELSLDKEVSSTLLQQVSNILSTYAK